MHDQALVRESDGIADAREDSQTRFEAQAPPVAVREQGLAGYPLHDEEGLTGRELAGVKQTRDSRVIESSENRALL